MTPKPLAPPSPPAVGAVQPEPAERPEEPELAAFYAALSAYARNTGHNAAMFDVWLMGRGLMGTNGRATPPAAQGAEPPDAQPGQCAACGEYRPARTSEALMDLNSVEAMLGGANGPTIRIRSVLAREHAPAQGADDRAALRAALAELVSVKDLKDRTEAIGFAGPSGIAGDAWEAVYKDGRREYLRRQPAAWDAARAALSHPVGAGAEPAETGVHEAASLRQEPVAADGGLRKLARFGALMFRLHRNDGCPGDVDGGSAQEAAEESGCIEARTVAEPCGEHCECAGIADFPTTCYFTTDDVAAAMKDQA